MQFKSFFFKVNRIVLKKTPTMCIKYALRRRNNYKGAEIGIKEKLKETKKSARDISEVKPQT